MQVIQRITPCLWFDDQAEEAAEFYTGIFRNSKIVEIARYGEAGHEVHGKPAGTVMTVAFELDGQAPREGVQSYLRELLEQEVGEALGRLRYARPEAGAQG